MNRDRGPGFGYSVGIDLDGVVYDWQGAFVYLLNNYCGSDLDTSLEWWDSWNAIEEHISEDHLEWVWTEGVRLGLFRYGHIIKGAVEGLRALSEHVELHVVTHRPAIALKDTLRFVENLPDVFSGVHFLTGGQPKSSVGLDIYVDDALHVVQDVRKAGKYAVLFDRPWNRAARLGSAKGWDEVVDEVIGVIA